MKQFKNINLPITVIVGLISGFIGASLGISSAPFLLPALLIFSLVNSYKLAIGTVILTIVPPLSILALYNYYNAGFINIPLTIINGMCYIRGIFWIEIYCKSITNYFSLYDLCYLIWFGSFWFYLATTGKYITKGSGSDIGLV